MSLVRFSNFLGDESLFVAEKAIAGQCCCIALLWLNLIGGKFN